MKITNLDNGLYVPVLVQCTIPVCLKYTLKYKVVRENIEIIKQNNNGMYMFISINVLKNVSFFWMLNFCIIVSKIQYNLDFETTSVYLHFV